MILLFPGVDTGSYDGNFYSELDDLKINGLKLNETLNFTKFLAICLGFNAPNSNYCPWCQFSKHDQVIR